MRTLGIAVAASLLVLAACGDKEDEVPLDAVVADATVAPVSDLTYADVDWEAWTPVYGELRPADEAAVAEVSQRITDLNASSWTVHESTTDSEISYTPEHVRLRSDHLDLHFAPDVDLDDSNMTACTDEACSRLDPSDDEDTEAEALVDAVRGPYFVLPMQLGLLEEIEEPLDEGASAISTVESPAGPVDCLVVAEEQRDLEALVGEPMVRDDEGGTFVGWCVDQRGLVIVDYDDGGQVPLYDAWRPGVDDDATELVPAPEVSEAPVDPTGDFEDVLWATWDGELQDVHPATEAEVDALEDRVAALNQTPWTGALDGYGATMSVTPRHVRVDMGFGEWHFDTLGSPFKTPYVLCLHDEQQCVRVRKDADAGGSPHLFNNDLDSMTFTWLVVLGTQRAGLDYPSDEPPVLATIDSPVGPLDCLANGVDAAELDADELASLMGSNGESSIICVDQRGLVQLSTGGMLGPQGQYTSWHAGVDDGVDEIPYRVRDYND